MRIARVVGKLTLTRSDPSLKGARWLIAVPYSLEALQGNPDAVGEELVVYDDLGAAEGQLIAISEGAEASGPFHPELKPLDAYCAAILDTIQIGNEPEIRAADYLR